MLHQKLVFFYRSLNQFTLLAICQMKQSFKILVQNDES